jgi:outer membrane lipoprotein carrier protein
MNALLLAAWLLGAAPAAPAPPKATQSKPAPPAAATTSPKVRALVERVQAFYEHTRDFEARFTQRYVYATSHRTQVSQGEVKFKKPGLMRWDYQTPSARTFLLAQDRAYALDREALTLTKSPLDQNQLSAAVTFLWGKGNLLDEFTIAEQPCPKCQGVELVLTPKKPDPRFQRILLEVAPKTAQVLKSTVVDPDGSVNEITFEGLKTNVKLTDDQFKLTPPPNTQVLDLTQRR